MYTEKYGKITAIAKGAKKGSGKFTSSTLCFCYGEYILYKGRSMYILNDAVIIDSFQNFLRDLETITYCSYINELIYIGTVEEENNYNLFKNLITCYYFIENKVGDMETLIRAFEIKFLSNIGYGLNLEVCVHCGEKIKSSNYLDLSNLGMTCNKCCKNWSVRISSFTYNILRYIINSPLEKIYKVNLDSNMKEELKKITGMILEETLNRKPKSLDILNYINKE